MADPVRRPDTPARRTRRRLLGATVLVAVVVIVAAVSAAERGPRTSGPATTTSSSTTGPSTTSPGGEDDVGGPGAPTIQGTVVSTEGGAASRTGACRSGPPLANVYHPNRLTVVRPCTTLSGTVESVRSEPDGDTHFDLALDGAYSGLLTAANRSAQHGWLVAEIVPADEVGCTPGRPPRPPEGTYDYGICTGADEQAPALGQHVWVTGPYVLDEDHGGWAEIHPVWAVSSAAPSQAPGTTSPAAPAAPPPAAAGAARGVRILSVSSPVTRGSEASLTAQAWAGAACDLEVTLPSGARSQSQGLGPGQADSSGRVAWSWRTGTRTAPGTATATVTCGPASASAPFQITA